MGSKARRRRERNTALSRTEAAGRARVAASTNERMAASNAPRARRIALIATAAIVVVGGAIAVMASLRVQAGRAGAPGAGSSATATESTSMAGSAAALPSTSGAGTGAGGASARGAAESTTATDLDKAADAVGFQVSTGPNVGVVENLPADTTLLPPGRSLLPVGTAAPDFTLFTPDRKKVRLSDYRGKTVLLEIFATWCPHCQAEAPHLLRLYNALPASNVVFLSVNGDSEDAASIHAFTRYFGLPWPALLDPGSPAGSFRQEGGIGPVSRAYGLSYFPTFYIIDAKGRIAWRGDREQPDMLLLQKLRDVSGS